MRFEWSAAKAAVNFRKHAVSFREAVTVFGDALSATVPDADHSMREVRFLTLGRSSHGRLLVVAHTDTGDAVRVISARQATSRERRSYEEGQH